MTIVFISLFAVVTFVSIPFVAVAIVIAVLYTATDIIVALCTSTYSIDAYSYILEAKSYIYAKRGYSEMYKWHTEAWVICYCTCCLEARLQRYLRNGLQSEI